MLVSLAVTKALTMPGGTGGMDLAQLTASPTVAEAPEPGSVESPVMSRLQLVIGDRLPFRSVAESRRKQ